MQVAPFLCILSHSTNRGLEPNYETNYLLLGNAYMCLNRLEEAEAVYTLR